MKDVEKNRKDFIYCAESKSRTTSSSGRQCAEEGADKDDSKELCRILRRPHESLFSEPINTARRQLAPPHQATKTPPSSDKQLKLILFHPTLRKPLTACQSILLLHQTPGVLSW